MASQLALGAWAPQYNAALGQYFTPEWLARRLVDWAEVEAGMPVIEPSAGGGGLVQMLLDAGCVVTAVEVDPAWCRFLRDRFPGLDVIEADFLTYDFGGRRFERSVMNPDLTAGRGVRHVDRALDLAPRVVSVLRAQDLHSEERFPFWTQRARLDGVAYCSTRPKFKDDGGQAEFVAVDVRLHSAGQVYPRIEWWSNRAQSGAEGGV